MRSRSSSKIGRDSGEMVQRHSEYSKFVDRVNAQRFKLMVGGSSREDEDQPKIGLPFSIDRPHAVAAHWQLEHKLKPAARRTRTLIFGT